MVFNFIETGLMIYDRVVKGAEDIKALKLSKKALLRAYFFEVNTNIELLKVIDIKKLKTLKVNSPSVFSIAKNLEIQIAASIVFSDDAAPKELFEFLSRKGNVKETGEEAANQNEQNKTVLQAIDFTLRKIIILQKLSTFKGEEGENIVNTLRLKTRVENIWENLAFVRSKLLEFNKTENFLLSNEG